jgi:hypothetical protein
MCDVLYQLPPSVVSRLQSIHDNDGWREGVQQQTFHRAVGEELAMVDAHPHFALSRFFDLPV